MEAQRWERRLRRSFVGSAAVLLALVSGCGGGPATGTATTTPSTDGPTSTPTSTTSPATTSSMTLPATSTTVSAYGFEPACDDRDATTSTVPDGDPALDVLGLLGEEPVVQLELPTVRSLDVLDASRVRVWRIPGGMMVELRPYNDGTLPVAALLAVDANGSVRWRRCLDRAPDLVVLAQSETSTEFVVGWVTYGATGPIRTDLEVWSLATGSISRTWDHFLADNGITGAPAGNRSFLSWGGNPVLVLGPQGPRPSEPTDTLLVVDLAAMATRVLPYPPTAVGRPVDQLQLEFTSDGRLVALDPSASGSAGHVDAVESAGGWSSDVGALDAAVGLRVDFDYGAPFSALHAVDAQGRERWRRDDLLAPPREGFHLALDSDVVLVSACSQIDLTADVPCSGERFVAVDARTGRTLWDRPGIWALSVIGDGVAMVAGPPTGVADAAQPDWMMISLSTGRPVSARTWADPWRFSVGCCDEPARVYRSGGVVFTVDSETVEMWYPEEWTKPLQVVPFG